MNSITVSLPPKEMELFHRLLTAARQVAWVELDASPEDVDGAIDAFRNVIKAHLEGGPPPPPTALLTVCETCIEVLSSPHGIIEQPSCMLLACVFYSPPLDTEENDE